jgi:dolichol-phosphate hexosyltransferase
MVVKKTTSKLKSISIVIPAFNEKEGIEQTIKNIPRFELEQAGFSVQVLVVDGCSDDGTLQLAKKAGAEIIVEHKRGYGRAYKTGFQAAIGDIIVTADADGTYPVEDIPRLVRLLESEKLDFINTTRFPLINKGAMSLRNRVGNTILAVETRLLFNLKMKDPESGMWIFKKNILDRLKLKSDNGTFSHEIKIQACYFAGCNWVEVPVKYYSRIGGSGKLTSGWTGWKSGFANLFHISLLRIKKY